MYANPVCELAKCMRKCIRKTINRRSGRGGGKCCGTTGKFREIESTSISRILSILAVLLRVYFSSLIVVRTNESSRSSFSVKRERWQSEGNDRIFVAGKQNDCPPSKDEKAEPRKNGSIRSHRFLRHRRQTWKTLWLFPLARRIVPSRSLKVFHRHSPIDFVRRPRA